MNPHPVFKIIDEKFVQAVNTIQEAYQKHPDKNKMSDNRIGLIISPSNRYVVKKIRKGEASLNHYQMLTFADHFNIPYEYFYYKDLVFEFSFTKNDPSGFVSDVNARTLDTHLTDKIHTFVKQLEESDDQTYDKTQIKLLEFKSKTIEKLDGVPFDKALSILDYFFGLIFTEIENSSIASTSLQGIKNKQDVEHTLDNNLSYLQNLLQSTREMNKVKDQLIESKDHQIELLNKDIKRMEDLLGKK